MTSSTVQRLANVAVDAVFDSESIGTTFQKELQEASCDEYPISHGFIPFHPAHSHSMLLNALHSWEVPGRCHFLLHQRGNQGQRGMEKITWLWVETFGDCFGFRVPSNHLKVVYFKGFCRYSGFWRSHLLQSTLRNIQSWSRSTSDLLFQLPTITLRLWIGRS